MVKSWKAFDSDFWNAIDFYTLIPSQTWNPRIRSTVSPKTLSSIYVLFSSFHPLIFIFILQAYLRCHVGGTDEPGGNDANHDGRKPYSLWCYCEALADLQYVLYPSLSSSSPISDSFVGIDKHLPKPQRRGAIIILGMLALAKRSVLTDKVDVMLRVGLGPLGKVRIKTWILSCTLHSLR